MINSKDVETTKELVVSAVFKAMTPLCLDTSDGMYKKIKETKIIVIKAFDIVIKEMKDGGI